MNRGYVDSVASSNQHARARRTAATRRQRELAQRRPMREPTPATRPPLDPRSFLARMKRRIAAGSILTFGAFFGLATMNVVGVTSLGSGQAGTPSATTAPVLPPGDFFGQPGTPIVGAPAIQPQVILGGGPPMLTSSGS